MPFANDARWLSIVAALSLAACGGAGATGPSAPAGATIASMTVTSASFAGGAIPIDFSCDGKDASPQVTWSSVPEGTRGVAIVLDDPDAPGATFTHWIVFDLPATTVSLAEGVDPTSLGAKIGTNDFGSVRYEGPCPPRGEAHQYALRVYAVDAPLAAHDGAKRREIDAALRGHVLGEGALKATFGH